VAAAGARRVAARKRQWMIGSSNRDPFDATDVDAFYPGDCLIEGSADSDHRPALEHRLPHCPERFDIEAQRDCRKLCAKCLERVAHALRGQHQVEDKADFRLDVVL
jgi:hypothetical protein